MNDLQKKVIKIQVNNRIKKMNSVDILCTFFDKKIKLSSPIDLEKTRAILSIILQLEKYEQLEKVRRLKELKVFSKI